MLSLDHLDLTTEIAYADLFRRRAWSMSRAAPTKSPILSETLRLVRQRRGLSAVEVARRMAMNIRTFRHFEAGKTQLDFARIRAFADATDSDPYAILAAVMLETPAFAAHTIDNKIMTVIMAGVRRFEDRLGDRMARIEVSRLVAAFRKVFDGLEAELLEREAEAQAWLSPQPREPDRGEGDS